MDVLKYIALAFACAPFIWWGTNLLDDALEDIGAYFGFPEIVRGAVLKAIGSSFPELMSVILATLLHGNFTLGVGAIVGSAIFNIKVIPGLSAIASPEGTLNTNRDVVFKDGLFYILAVAALFLTMSIATVYNPTPSTPMHGDLTRLMVIPLLLLYALYIYLQILDTKESDEEKLPIPESGLGATFLKLGVSLVLVSLAVEGLLQAGIGIGDAMHIPPFIWGLTVLAAVTSLPDAQMSIKDARKDSGVSSVANVLGSNTFDLLVCIPIGVLLAGSATINFEQAVPMMGALMVATLVLFLLLRWGFDITRKEGLFLLCLYGLFCTWIVVESMGLLHILNIK